MKKQYKLMVLVCLFGLFLPSFTHAWNTTYNNRVAFNISNPDSSAHPFEVVTVNFTGIIGQNCENNTLVVANTTNNEVQIKFELLTNTADSCAIRFIRESYASESSGNTAGYFYYNFSGNGSTNTALNRYGVLTYLSDKFGYPSWNNTRWGQGIGACPSDCVTLNTSETVAQIVGNGLDFNSNFYNNKTNVNFTRDISLFFFFRVLGGANIDMGWDNGTTVATDYTDGNFKGDLFQSAMDLHYEGGIQVYSQSKTLTDNLWYSYQTTANSSRSKFWINYSETLLINSINITGASFLENVRFGGSSGIKQIDNITIINGTAIFYFNNSVILLNPPEWNGTGITPPPVLLNGSFTRTICLTNQTLQINSSQIININGTPITIETTENKYCEFGCFNSACNLRPEEQIINIAILIGILFGGYVGFVLSKRYRILR